MWNKWIINEGQRNNVLTFKYICAWSNMMLRHSCNANTYEAEIDGLQNQSKSDYTERPRLIQPTSHANNQPKNQSQNSKGSIQ